MITKIGMNCVASFNKLATLETDKKINLIYGLNGTGKSTFSNYLYDKNCMEYSNCFIEGISNETILVYNQKFIRDYFYESDLKGIFTLSKENKEAEEKIKNAQNEIGKLENEIAARTKKYNALTADLAQKRQDAEGKVWEIKTTFTGGDRVLEFCLDRLKNKKEKLYDHLSAFSKSEQQPGKTTEELKREVEALNVENAQRHDSIPVINFTGYNVESNRLLQKEIIGNESSTVAELIKNLKNSDWVKKGLGYIPKEVDDDGVLCPFCQERTITKTLVYNIKNYFDEIYETEINALTKLLSDYETAINAIQSRSLSDLKF
jgi:wobble nucleotide-excising tRNase